MHLLVLWVVLTLLKPCLDRRMNRRLLVKEEPTTPSRLVYTSNHVYSPGDALGRGATADVFKGYERSTGAVRALKVTKSAQETREINREIAALVSLNHENVVKMIGIETEEPSGCVVLVTEYCPGGSLFTHLQEPENHRGLPDPEYRRLLSGLSNGLKHIRNNGFVHRDLKPGNILRSLDSAGRSVYKLADFGAARQLEENEGYLSLAGTEEYLHPDIYYTAFINRRSGHQFTASSDLWSLGATLYHAAAGDTPFKPFRGARNDRETMQRMLSSKPRGAVRGVQLQPDGEINWREALPSDVNMSRNFSTLIVPMIQGLMEKEARYQWSFATFFDRSQHLLSLAEVSCCQPAKGIVEPIYLQPNTSFAEIQRILSEVTGIPQSRQVLMLGDSPVSESEPLSRLLKRYEDTPLVVLDNALPPDPQKHDLPEKEQVQSLLRFSSPHMDLAKDASVCLQNTCRVFGVIQHLVQITVLQKISTCVPFVYGRIFAVRVASLEQRLGSLEVAFKERCIRLDWFIRNYRVRDPECQSDSIRAGKELRLQLEELFSWSKQTLTQMKDWINNTPNLVNSEDKWCDKCLASARHYFTEMKDILVSMKTRKRKEAIQTVEELYHKADRLKLESVSNEVYAVWHSHCSSSRSRTRKGFLSWNSLFIENMRKETQLKEVVEKIVKLNYEFEEQLKTINTENYEWEKSAQERLNNSIKRIPNLNPTVIQENQRLTQNLEVLISTLPDVAVLKL